MDQQQVWENRHSKGDHVRWSDEPRPFAIKVAPGIEPGSRLLELGCGVGSDARFFAQKGANVLATDFSEAVVTQNVERGVSKNLQFAVVDITKPLPYDDEVFDAVYAYLSLHYYDDDKTKDIIEEIARVLKPRGKLYFSCKSVHDRKFGVGEQLAPDIFMDEGQIRHFFSLDYTRQLVAQSFKVIRLDETSSRYGNNESHFIECWTTKDNDE